MKSSILMGCLILSLGATCRVFAVWPPETMLQEEANKPSSTSDVNAAEPALPRPRALVDRLEDDERRLEKALIDLRKDTLALKHNATHPAGD